MKEITREQLFAIPAFEQSFKDERFKNEIDTFLGYVNACASKDVRNVIGGLLKCSCSISWTFRCISPFFRPGMGSSGK